MNEQIKQNRWLKWPMEMLTVKMECIEKGNIPIFIFNTNVLTTWLPYNMDGSML